MAGEKQIEEMAAVINEMDGRNAHYYDQYMRECEAFADADAIAKADELGITMIFTGVRHFKH